MAPILNIAKIRSPSQSQTHRELRLVRLLRPRNQPKQGHPSRIEVVGVNWQLWGKCNHLDGAEVFHRVGSWFAKCPQFPGADDNGKVPLVGARRDILHPGDIHAIWNRPYAPHGQAIDWRRRAGCPPAMHFRVSIDKRKTGRLVVITCGHVITPGVKISLG